MYSVSEAYLTKMFDQIQTHKLSGTIDNIPFTGDDVIGVSWTNQCSDKNVVLGSVNIGTLKFTFLKDLLNRGEYYDKKITIIDSLLLGYTEEDEPIYEDVPIGVFYVGEATWTAEGMIDITAYDVLSKLDIPLAIEQASGYLYDFCKVIERHTGAPFGMTEEECQALTNGHELIAPYPENDMETYRDLLSKLSQMCGGFAYADRDGTWKLRSFDDISILSIGNTRRFSGAKYSDFETRFDGLSYQDVMTTGETIYIGDENGFVMELGNNPFLQYGSSNIVLNRATNIFNVVQGMTYTPFTVSLLPAFCVLDLADVISFTNDYTGNTSTGACMSLTWTYNKSIQVQCYGSNPNIRNAKTKQDHASAGQASSSKENRISTFVSTNIQQIEVGDEKTEILKMLFTTSGEQALLTLTEVKFNLEDADVVEVFYALNGEELLYVPTETYSEGGLHTLSLMYPIEGLEKDRRYRFTVKMRCSNGAVIEPLSARCYIQGTGYDLTGQFDGYLDVQDDLYLVGIGYLEPLELLETVVMTEADLTKETASELVSFTGISHLTLESLADSVAIYMEFIALATEDRKKILTEDGKIIRIEM